MPLLLLSKIDCGLFYEVSWVVSSKYAWRPLQVTSVLFSAIEARLAGAHERCVAWVSEKVRGLWLL